METLTRFLVVLALLPLLFAVSVITTASLFSAGDIAIQIFILFLLLGLVTWESVSYFSRYLAEKKQLRRLAAADKISFSVGQIAKGADPLDFETMDYLIRDSSNRSDEREVERARIFEELVVAIFRAKGFET